MEQYDEWPAMQFFTFDEFTFSSRNFIYYELGSIKRNGLFNCSIYYKCVGGLHSNAGIKVIIKGNPIPNLLMSVLTFDKAICLNDRILLFSTPAETNVNNITLNVLSSEVGYTCDAKYYSSNEPVVASIFTINRNIVKVSFSLSDPDRVIEIF